ncbi:hypothetical protein BKA66DRAFT_55406 [Pyrenochaeta sp. MPI-SDFR-AT-0127]|nr:hypothetical protein BKA66DRAFT_55406 [Pyrenochaeta sp. MPI-SDFR-AT-0127]
MRFSTLFVDAIIIVSSALATPIKSGEFDYVLVGNATNNSTRAYTLQVTGKYNVRIIGEKVNGEFMRPATYHVEQGHVCKFYSEATGGIGYPIGEYVGPIDGNFGRHWAAFYECWHVSRDPKSADNTPLKATLIAKKPRSATPGSLNAIPCGYALTTSGTQLSLNESGKGHMVYFAVNGGKYATVFYHISSGCDCRFFR